MTDKTDREIIKIANYIEELAFKMKAPNIYTPRFVGLANEIRTAIHTRLAQPEPRNQCGEACERAKLCAVCLAEMGAQPASPQSKPEQKPVTAQHRFRYPQNARFWFRHPEKTIPDWSKWQECKVSNRPAWEIDSQGYEVEYRNLYASPPEQKRREWQGITNEEIMDACSAVWASHPIEVGRVIEAKLKEKNT